VITPECGTRGGIFAALIARLLRRSRPAKRGVEDARLSVVGSRDDRDFMLLTWRQIDEAGLPGAIAAARVMDSAFGNRRVTHERSVETAGYGAQLAGERECFDEKTIPIGETIEEIMELAFREAVIDVAVCMLDHGCRPFPHDGESAADLTVDRPKYPKPAWLHSFVVETIDAVARTGHRQ
jgi:hypothetical protein